MKQDCRAKTKQCDICGRTGHLKNMCEDQKAKDKLVKEIRGQVDKGESVLAAQPMNNLAG